MNYKTAATIALLLFAMIIAGTAFAQTTGAVQPFQPPLEYRVLATLDVSVIQLKGAAIVHLEAKDTATYIWTIKREKRKWTQPHEPPVGTPFTLTILAATPFSSAGTLTELIVGGGTAASGLDKGDFLAYHVAGSAIFKKASVEYSRGNAGGSSLEIRTGSKTGPVIAVIPVNNTGTVWNSGYTESAKVTLAATVQTADIYVTFENAVGTTGRANLKSVKLFTE